ncbi:hypothetical protein PAP_05925 [Palaeococcus pacificus DY20341]|uniref:Uncharacterized protein n=1 Tax=Palaeococcus pacificus DY20341 TaxID=1343739 RepID=A0A075LS74_9EURY|nr:KEOPS complex subunit Cgi121 [Palaeococcus pacificus]AIF69585.1 hypothetical protein PAP_05925 [Palaeococcus pacificus DY20341]
MKVIQWNKNEIAIERVVVNDISEILSKLEDNMQIANVACWEQLAFATILALKSAERKTNKAKTVRGEILIRLVGTLQIHEAIRKAGVKEGENFIVAFGENASNHLREFIQKNNLKTVPIEDCSKDKAKSLMELSAIVDVL